MINGTTGLSALAIVVITAIMCRLAYLHGYDNGFKDGVRRRK